MNAGGQYLGDGVYASFDGIQIWLRTARDEGEETIALEYATLHALLDYARTVPMMAECVERHGGKAVSPERLAEMVKADARVRIYTDRFGGEFVVYTDANIYGARAIVHRRELLRAIERRQKEDPQWHL